MTTFRTRSKIDTDLPVHLKEQVHRLLVEGETYEGIAAFLKAEGYDISKSSIARYGKDFFEVFVHCANIDVVKQAHHLLRDPDALVGIDSLHAPLAAGGDEGQVLGCRGTDEGNLGFLGRGRSAIHRVSPAGAAPKPSP